LNALVKRHERVLLLCVLLFGLAVRLPFAPIDFHATGDLQTFRRWANHVQTVGLSRIYESERIDYPPVWLYWLAAARWMSDRVIESEQWLTALIKLPAMLADLGIAGLIALTLRSRSALAAILAASAMVLNPGIWYVSAYWPQIDSVYTIFLVASILALSSEMILPAWLTYIFAFMTKLQSIAVFPLLVITTLGKRGVRGLALGIATFVVAGAIITMPWLLTGHMGDIVNVYTVLPTESPRVDVSAYNLWYLLRLSHVHNVTSYAQPLGLPFSYQTLGILLFASYALMITLLAARSDGLALAAALLCLGLYMLPTQIHERYMFPALPFLALACAARPRLWIAYAVLSATFFFNLITVAPFTSALGINLIAVEVASTKVLILKMLSLAAAALNLAVLCWLTLLLAQGVRFRADLWRSRSISKAIVLGVIILIGFARVPALVADWHLNIGYIALTNGMLARDKASNIEHARRAFALAEEWNKQDGSLARARGRLALLTDKPEDAIAYFSRALSLGHGSQVTHFLLGLALDQAGNHTAAIVEWRQAHAANYFLQRGLTLRHQKDWKRAEAVFQQATLIAPTDATLQRTVGIFYWEWGNLDQALAHFRRALEFEHGPYEQAILRGEIALLEGREDGSEREFRVALLDQPRNPLAYRRLAELLAQTHRKEEAIATLKTGIERAFPTFDLFLRLGQFYAEDGQLLEAKRAYARASTLDPFSDEPLVLLGANAFAERDFADAEWYLQRALERAPNNAATHFWIARVRAQRGDWAGACAAYQRAAALASDDLRYRMPEDGQEKCQARK